MEQINKKFFNWASILEENTRKQAETTATMPFIFPHLALMPDAHLGKGATVGSVIPTLGAIIPAAVGVDIGCVDADSEYLSPQGWRYINEYKGEEVMQYDPETGIGSFVQPDAYIIKPADSFYKFKSKYGIDQLLTPDHKVLCWNITGRNRRRVMETLTAEEFALRDESLIQGYKAEFATTFDLEDSQGLDISDNVIRLWTMASADANFSGRKIVLRLRKERKILRAQELLYSENIPFKLKVNIDGVTTITFDNFGVDRSLNFFWEANAHQLNVIADECLYWDGNQEDRVYFSRIRENADLIQYAFTTAGYRAVLRQDVQDGAIDYRVFANTNTMVGLAGSDRQRITTVPSADGRAYCFTVPNGFWVMRRNGNVVMTGNCGMIAVRTNVKREDLPTERESVRKEIEWAIPLSAGRANNKIVATAEPRIEELVQLSVSANFDPADYLKNWELQLGTLGSGNHFIEITVDENDDVWLFLHSGSRGVGNKIATHHILVAQKMMEKYWISLPDKDLAYLVEGTDEFEAYITELQWAQHFALLNREEMMDRVIRQFKNWIGDGEAGHFMELERINCHHNYTTKERHFGKDVWLSRKGAIDASLGTPGLIPGSMGTASYVVEGKGNRLALNSSPHGAGRNYSRSAARKTFTMEQLTEAMEGIEWSGSKEFLDEIPQAYKDIDVVMEDAKDLVEIQHTLRQILNVKGN